MYLLQIHIAILCFALVGGAQLSCEERELSGDCCPNYYYNTTTRKCTLCPNGFIGINCSEKCQANFHGRGCQKQCPRHSQGLCHHITGECPHQVTTTLWTTPLLDNAHTSTTEHRNKGMTTTNNIQRKEVSLERGSFTTQTTSVEMPNKELSTL
ncbi:uncharacterized protein LOC125654560 isoform X2 [Ostrea edulis]|uniref:uncharacterized protein LOC125654560 isoform X2 n=1 Tax=Ostrea edulis TaxID=37623 RepID=UPI0024AF0685|nr:uncharacterized protein LOC125654560 isoform X2 [Ostrea edulis]